MITGASLVRCSVNLSPADRQNGVRQGRKRPVPAFGVVKRPLTPIGYAPGRRSPLCRSTAIAFGLSPQAKVLDLKSPVQCRGYGVRGQAVVSVKWGRREGRGRSCPAARERDQCRRGGATLPNPIWRKPSRSQRPTPQLTRARSRSNP